MRLADIILPSHREIILVPHYQHHFDGEEFIMFYARRLVVGAIFALLLTNVTAFATGWNQPITWQPEELHYTIGNGQGAATPVVVIFRSSIELENVEIKPRADIYPFVKISPSHFDRIEPETDYEVIIRYSIPPRTPECIIKSALELWSNGHLVRKQMTAFITVDYGDIMIRPEAAVISEVAADCLRSEPNDDTLLFVCGFDEIAPLAEDDILVAGVTPHTPAGLLRRVVDVSLGPNGMVVTTVGASLDEVLGQGTLSVSKRLTQTDLSSAVAADGARLASDCPTEFCADLLDLTIFENNVGKVTANGQVAFDPHFDFSASFDWDTGLDELSMIQTIDEFATFTFEATLNSELDKEKSADVFTFSPIVIWAGYVPVVIVPKIEVVAGAKGSASVGIKTEIQQEATASAGLRYQHGDWIPVQEFSTSFPSSSTEIHANANLKGYAGPELGLYLYGIAGPYANLHAYLDLNADIHSTPWWTLHGGLEAFVGARLEILDNEIANYETDDLLGYRVLLAQAPEVDPGHVSGVVSDAVTGERLPEVQVDVELHGEHVTTAFSDAQGSYQVDLTPESQYQLTYLKAGYLASTYYNVEVREDETTYLEQVLEIDESHGGPGSVSGNIVNALSGDGVSGLTVDLREGLNARTGPVAVTTSTGNNGYYSLSDLLAGSYTAEAHGQGYITTFFSVICIGGQESPNQNASITPILPPGETRIVLTWGASPRDLDSHSSGPLPGGGRFHMYYPYQGLRTPWPDDVYLDLDDVTSWGPETTTWKRQNAGTYRYSVHDYTNRWSLSSNALSLSGAQVRVYSEEGLIAHFNVPTGQPGTLWSVFEMEEGVIRPVNRMSFESDPSSVDSWGADAPMIDDETQRKKAN